MRFVSSVLLALAASAAWAEGPSFEVASIKPAAPQEMGKIMTRMGGDPGRVDFKNVSLRDLVRNAYDVKDYQVSAPDWMNNARFDVEAKVPPGTSQAGRRLMMQNLLAERFHLKVHKETKDLPAYSLVVGKNGPKIKKAEDGPVAAPGPNGDFPRSVPVAPPPPTDKDREVAGSGGGGRARGGAAFGGPAVGRGMMMMRMSGGTRMNMTAKAVTISDLAELLSRHVGAPVFDKTGLDGAYDIDLEFKPDFSMMKGMPMMHMEGGGPGPGGPGPGGLAPDASEAPTIFTAVQEQLGLKLESKKGPVETVVVDSADKTPTEN